MDHKPRARCNDGSASPLKRRSCSELPRRAPEIYLVEHPRRGSFVSAGVVGLRRNRFQVGARRPTRACSGRGPLRRCIASALPFRVAGHAAEAGSLGGLAAFTHGGTTGDRP